MKTTKRLSWFAAVALVLLALSLAAGSRAVEYEPAHADGLRANALSAPSLDVPASAAYVAESEIVVTSGSDPDISATKTCLNASPCTLRRAIVQANETAPAQRGVQIVFEIPKSDNSYNSSQDIWIIRPRSGSGASVFPPLVGGEIYIDGSSQEGGRFDGPQIFIVGPGTGGQDGLTIGTDNSGDDDGNEVIGLAFQNFQNHIVINSNGNIIAENWFGLSFNGLRVHQRDGDPEMGSGANGVLMASGVEENGLETNVFAGFTDVAVVVKGAGNYMFENIVGTTAEGVVPASFVGCGKDDWPGGGGISVAGSEHEIADNTLAGLRWEKDDASQPDAIVVSGSDHAVVDNFVGMDYQAKEVGVCGRGIVLANSPKRVQLGDNTVVNPARSGISLNGEQYDANSLTGNRIRRQNPWPGGTTAVQLGGSLPQSYRDFLPAQVSEIKGTTVTGESGANSLCRNCRIELFLDDRDNVVESLQSLAVVTANAQGKWQAQLEDLLTSQQGLRTMSTSAANNMIPGMSAGTTTGLSALYVTNEEYEYLPVVRGD